MKSSIPHDDARQARGHALNGILFGGMILLFGWASAPAQDPSLATALGAAGGALSPESPDWNQLGGSEWREAFYDYLAENPGKLDAAGYFFDFPPRLSETFDRSPASLNKLLDDLRSPDLGPRLEAIAALFWIGEPARGRLWREANGNDPIARPAARQVLELWEKYRRLYELHIASPRRADRYAISDAGAPLGDGSATSPAVPRTISADVPAPKSEAALIALTQERAIHGQLYRGMRLILANDGPQLLYARALENRLAIVLEAQDASGAWRPLEYLPEPCCGRRYADAVLEPGFYWAFSVPQHGGNFATTLRFRASWLSEAPEQNAPREDLFSNEFPGSIYQTQFADDPNILLPVGEE